MKFSEFIKSMLVANAGSISSKRVCGVVGWLIVIGVLIYCTIMTVQAPVMIDTFMICCMALLGIDSFTSIWRKYPDNSDDKSTNININNISSSKKTLN